MKAILTFKKADPWSGFTVYKDCKHAIGPYIKRSGVRYTGLENDEVLRQRLEKTLNIDLGPNSSYWDTFSIFLGEKDIHLDTEVPEQELQYYFLKGHKRVSFGLNDMKPSTDYVLMQEEEEAKELNLKARVKRQAISEFDRLTPNEMRKALRLYGYGSSNSSLEIIESTLFKLVEENPSKFLQIWVNNNQKETQFLIDEASSKGIIRKNKTTYYYGTDALGYSLDETIDYLNNPANSSLRMSIKSQLEGKEYSFGAAIPTSEGRDSQFSKILSEIDSEEPKQNKTKSKKSEE